MNLNSSSSAVLRYHDILNKKKKNLMEVFRWLLSIAWVDLVNIIDVAIGFYGYSFAAVDYVFELEVRNF